MSAPWGLALSALGCVALALGQDGASGPRRARIEAAAEPSLRELGAGAGRVLWLPVPPTGGPAPANSLEPVSLRVLTFNLGLLKAPGVGSIVPFVDERFALIPEAVADYADAENLDVLVLQEVWLPQYGKPIQEALERRGFATLYPGRPFPFVMGSGLLLAVRRSIPVLEARFVLFGDRARYEKNVFRGLLLCRLAPAGTRRPLVLVGTHLQSVASDPLDTDALAKQKAQVRQLNGVFRRFTEDGRLPVLMLGDLNLAPGEENYRTLTKAYGFTDAFAALRPGEAGCTYCTSNPLTQLGVKPLLRDVRIDHIIVRSGRGGSLSPVEARVVFDAAFPSPAGPLFLSDHFGMRATIRYEPAKREP